MYTFGYRTFNTREEFEEYKRGYYSYPRWPAGAELDSIAATGFFDAERARLLRDEMELDDDSL